jgi:hypothetical protein
MTDLHRLPDAAGAFTLSVTEAARFLNITPQQLLDLTQAGQVTALYVQLDLINERPPLRYAPGLLTEVAEMLANRKIEGDSADVHLVARCLRAFLDEKPPLDDYDLARETGSPMLAADRAGTVYAHLKADLLVEYVCNHEGFMMGSRVRAALVRLGAIQVRGIHSLNDRRQRWGTWWRLPQTLWSVDRGATAFDLAQVLGGRTHLVPDSARVVDGD